MHTVKPSRGSTLGRISRCRGVAAKLREKLGEKAVHTRTGCMLRASFWPAKMVWLRKTDPKLFERVKLWMSPAEWLQFKLTGEAQCSTAMASGTGLFNPSRLKWDEELLKTCRLRAENMRPVSEEAIPVGGELADDFPDLRWGAVVSCHR